MSIGVNACVQGVRVGDQSNQNRLTHHQATNQGLLSCMRGKWCLTPFLLLAARAALCLGLFLVATGCTVTGSSPRDIKNELQDSFLYKSIGMFSDGSASGPFDAKLPVSREQRAGIEREYLKIVSLLLDVQQQQAKPLKELFPNFDADRARVRVSLTDRNLDAPTIGLDGSITVDVKLARLMFRDAVLEAMKSEGLGSIGFMDGWKKYCGATPVDDAAYLQCFLGLRERIDRIQPKTVIGSMLSESTWRLDEDDTGSFFYGADLAISSQELLGRYTGLLFFVTAHEVAHVSLGHLQALRAGRMRHPDAIRAAEHEADAFAVALLVLATPHLALFDDTAAGAIARGFEDFFSLTYRNARWAENSETHPSSEQRLAAAHDLYVKLREAQTAPMWAALLSGVSRPADNEPAAVPEVQP